MDLSCDTCYNLIEDEESGESYCAMECAVDEDDSATLAAHAQKRCPFYRFNDEYISVRKQN
jgi:hypothetical protein